MLLGETALCSMSVALSNAVSCAASTATTFSAADDRREEWPVEQRMIPASTSRTSQHCYDIPFLYIVINGILEFNEAQLTDLSKHNATRVSGCTPSTDRWVANIKAALLSSENVKVPSQAHTASLSG